MASRTARLAFDYYGRWQLDYLNQPRLCWTITDGANCETCKFPHARLFRKPPIINGYTQSHMVRRWQARPSEDIFVESLIKNWKQFTNFAVESGEPKP